MPKYALQHSYKLLTCGIKHVEVLLTASPEWWRDYDDCIDRKKVDQFCKAAKAFLSDRKNGGICVKAILHMDEHSPHVHSHMVPIDPEGKLNCKHYFGTRGKLSRWQDAFAEQVKPLGLERGEEGSRARHTDIKDFYKAIEHEHRIRVNYERLPDPPKICVTKESAQKFKEEFTKALIEQIQEPINTQLHQAMLARDTQNKLKETKKRLGKTQSELARHQLMVQDLAQEKEQIRQRSHGLLERAQAAEARMQDVGHGTVMRMLGYRAVLGQQRGVIDYIKPEKNLLVSVFPGTVYDAQGQMIARNAVNLVQEIMRREGNNLSRDAVVGWLADKCGDERATSASLVEREQATEEFLHERRQERARKRSELVRDERLPQPELERIHDRGFERDGQERDFGFTR